MRMKTVRDELRDLLRRKYMESFYKANSLMDAPNCFEYERGKMAAIVDLAIDLGIPAKELFER